MFAQVSFTRFVKMLVLPAMTALVIWGSVMQSAHADILLFPTRVIFAERDRQRTIVVVNNSEKPAIFKMKWSYLKQVEGGGYQELSGPMDPAHDPGKMLIFSPRQITLPPQGKQTIRLVLRKPADLPIGEYHAHLVLERVNIGNEKDFVEKGKQLAKLDIVMNFSLPVVIRNGKSDASVKIEDVSFTPATTNSKDRKVHMTLRRTGNFGAMGNVSVYWSPSSGSEQLVGQQNGINIFPEIKSRVIEVGVPLNVNGGKLRIVYDGAEADKGVRFDEVNVPVQ